MFTKENGHKVQMTLQSRGKINIESEEKRLDKVVFLAWWPPKTVTVNDAQNKTIRSLGQKQQ